MISNFLRNACALLSMALFAVTSAISQISESFETGLPTSYTTTTSYTLSSGTWTGSANQVIRGTSGVTAGSYSLQLRSQAGAQATTPNITTGVGVVSFYGSSSTTSGAVQVNYSTDGGSSWTPAPGSPFSLTQGAGVFKTTTINDNSPNILVQFLRTSAAVFIDEVSITSFASGCTAPATQASAITFSSITENSMGVNWTNGNGAGRVVIMNTANAFTAPANGSNPSANTTYSGSGEQVVYNGTGSGPISISGLNPSTTYWFQVYEFCNPDRNYNATTATDNPNSATTAVCSSSTHFFRSNGTGAWSDASIWQTSVDGTTWTSTLCAPDFNANTIAIRNGHTVSMTSAVTVDQVVIENGGILRQAAGGAITLNNGSGDDLLIQNGGVWLYDGGALVTYQNADVRIRVQSGGRIQMNSNPGGSSNALAGNGSSNRVIYEHESIFEWNNSNAFASAGQVYFPDVNAATLPVFLVSSNVTSGIGTSAITRFNGVVHVSGSLLMTDIGEKRFRNGIIGSGTVEQTSNCGRFHFDGTVAYLGGGGTINLDFERINIANGTTLELIGNHTLNTIATNPNLGQLRVTTGATIDFGPYELSGTANIRFNNNATIKTSHPDGMDGAIGGLASFEYMSPFEQTLEFYRNGEQTSGNAAPAELAHLILGNGTSLYINEFMEVSESFTFGTGSICTVDPELTLTLQQNATITGASVCSAGDPLCGTTNHFRGPIELYAEENVATYFPIGFDGYGAQGFTIKPTNGSGYVRAYLEINDSEPEYNFAYCDIETTTAPDSQVGDGTSGPDGFLDQFEFNLASALQWIVTNPDGGINVYDIEFIPTGDNDFSGDVAIAADATPIRFTLRNGIPGNPSDVDIVSVPDEFEDLGFFACPNGYALLGQTGFSAFLNLGSTYGNTNLPIELIAFNATPNQKVVDLTWATASELNNDFFTVERSIDGLTWENVVTVNGAGTTNQRSNYSNVDTRPLAGLSYYRLKQTDYDGQFSYSDIKSVFMNTENAELIQVVNVLGQTVDQNTKGLVILLFSNGESIKLINE